MSYLIPRGTPVEIALYGHTAASHTTKCDLAFREPLSATPDALVFHDGYWQIIVSRSLVIEYVGGDGGSANERPV
jgi:hypothetical protein